MKVLVFSTLVLIMKGCGPRVADLSSDTKYSRIVHTKYLTQKEFVVYKNNNNRNSMLRINDIEDKGFPARSKMEKGLPYIYHSKTIYGILPKETIFEVVGVVKEKTFEYSHIYIEAEIVSREQFEGKKVDVTLLTDFSEVPKILEQNAREVKECFCRWVAA